MNNSLPNGLVETLGSGTSVADAVARVEAAIEANENLGLIAKVDHGAGAVKAGLELEPTVEIFLGNPKVGTPLMQIARTAAIDLPQKIVITQDGDGVRVLHNDPAYLASRHGIPADTPQLAMQATALQNVANVAAGVA